MHFLGAASVSSELVGQEEGVYLVADFCREGEEGVALLVVETGLRQAAAWCLVGPLLD